MLAETFSGIRTIILIADVELVVGSHLVLMFEKQAPRRCFLEKAEAFRAKSASQSQFEPIGGVRALGSFQAATHTLNSK
jgi:hypothetical protein